MKEKEQLSAREKRVLLFGWLFSAALIIVCVAKIYFLITLLLHH